jgi:pimeloyl-ACP methyl ester carboxylesterase
MRNLVAAVAAALMSSALSAAPAPSATKPTIVLVHGAFAESAGWNGVISRLSVNGYPTIAVAVPLRSLKGDSAYVGALLSSIPGDVVLVGHSYGGEVISVAGAGHANVKALVFVDGLAPEVGESAASLGARFPTATLAQALAPPVALSDGTADIYIAPAKYRAQFAADVPPAEAALMAATQRPIVKSALEEPAAALSWRTVPSWFVWGSRDLNIPPALHAFMAKRAQAREAVEVPGGSHVVMISHPEIVASMIERAAAGQPGR